MMDNNSGQDKDAETDFHIGCDHDRSNRTHWLKDECELRVRYNIAIFL